ncbi:MAG: hypothetical protein KKE50_06310 [Nanoarchaeota archaeon]|nr:hypothetical protein [Nanoarchaeota archaeon]
MRKIFMLLIIGILLASFASAARYEDNYFKYGTIDSSGNIVETSTPVNDVNVLGFVCSSANCASVSSNLWSGNVLNSGDDFIQLTYPTILLSQYGYGVYMYKEGYIPYEVSADWWGTNSNDPGAYNNFLTKKQFCHPDINSVQTQTISGNVNVNVNVHSPIDNAGPLNYIPPAIASHYSASMSVRLEAWKNNSLVYSQNKTVIIPFSGNGLVSFSFPASAGNYNILVYSSTSDAKCLDYHPDYENKTVIIACDEDSDCGNSYCLAGDGFCSGLNVYRSSRSFSCVNPGTASSACTNSTSNFLVGSCDYSCVLGKCFGN